MGQTTDVFRQNLAALYKGGSAAQYARYAGALDRFKEAFGGKPDAFFSVPGRSELGGNHTDHQHGRVLTAAVDLDTIAAVRREAGENVTVHSDGYPPFTVDLRSLSPDPAEKGAPAGLVRGIASRMKEHGFAVGGFSAVVTSNVLPGSGLSSSASFEVLIGAIFNALYNDNAMDPTEIAKTARYAENEFFGKPCGLQDQMACALGGVSYIDFKEIEHPAFKKIPFILKEHGYLLCITNTGGGHAGLTEEYAAIFNEMRSVARELGQDHLRFCDARDFFRSLPALRKSCGDRAVLRAYHFFTEDERPEKMADALLADDFPAFLALVNESGHSSYQYLQNAYVSGRTGDQALCIGLALSDRLLSCRGAWRVHGGGFAGTIQAYVPEDLLEDYKSTMEQTFGRGNCHVLTFREDGPVLLPIV